MLLFGYMRMINNLPGTWHPAKRGSSSTWPTPPLQYHWTRQYGPQYIEMAARKRPNSKIIVSRYIEVAMVAHNGVGYASDTAKAKVVVSYFRDNATLCSVDGSADSFP